MRLIDSAALLTVLASVLSLVSAKQEPSEVVELSEKSFDEFLTAHNVSLVEYFAPWCGHCQRLEPEFKKAASLLKETGIKLASIDCEANKEFCLAREIRGYPTLKIFNNGKDVDYDGPREALGIVNHMKKLTLPAVSYLSPHQLESFAKNEDVRVVAVLPEGSKDAETFKKVAESLRMEHSFAQIQPGIYMLKKFDEGFAKFPGAEVTEQTLTKWINTESTPLMGEVTPENYGKYMSAGLPMAYLFYSKDAMRKDYGEVVEDVVRPYKGKVNTVYIDADKFETHAKALTLPATWPGFVIHDMENDLKYPFKGKLVKEELEKFMTDYINGKVEPTYRSQEIPEKEEEGSVKTIVYKNFEKIVMDEAKDVLLELYAPWCGACKRLAPTYEELAKKYAPLSDKVVIAKMDGTENDLPKSANIKLTKFPTIILFKAGAKKEQVEFDRAGDKVSTFVEFIAKHGTHKAQPPSEPEESSAAAAKSSDTGKKEKDEL